MSARPACDKIAANELSNIHCKLVMDNNDTTNGSILVETHYDNIVSSESQFKNDHSLKFSNDGNIRCITHLTSKDGNKDNTIVEQTAANSDAAWNFEIKGKSDSVDCVIEQKSSTYEGNSKYKIDDKIASTESYIDIDTKSGDLTININDKSSGHSYIVMTKAGVLTIDTTDKVVIHAPNEIQLTSDSTININAGS